ncbi:extensin-like domain-containing protein [Xanthobacter dioxanivorans]|uniref:extensin-like domain-containing protein n=1 Tax=Xanthobacter dioxanivorans TaxID=2528964 RepID=UPI001E5B8731|nr:extensin family protein [Xanthobacter dioxanivorans]
MARGSYWLLIAPLLLAGLLSGCRFGFETRDPWRAEEEEKCLSAKGVVPSPFVEPLPAIDGPGMCGMEHPFRVSALAQGNVVVEPAAKLACPVIYETERWMQEVVQPAAMAWLGEPIVAISQMSSYSCRGMNGNPNAKISEHAFGNALDVGAFRTADGRWITVKTGWKGPPNDRGFLLQVQAGACERFTTVLAPGSNVFHYDHIHVDLMRHEKGRTICKPAPRPMPAPFAPPMVEKAPPMAVSLPEPAPEPAAAPPPQAPPSFLSTLFAPRPAPAQAQPTQAQPPLPEAEPPSSAALPRPAAPIIASPAPPPPPSSRAPAPTPAGHQPPPQGLPPGWQVGPQGVPMSYGPAGNIETGSVKRKYYSAPMPQPSTIPLPSAKPGED